MLGCCHFLMKEVQTHRTFLYLKAALEAVPSHSLLHHQKLEPALEG